jgi:magnesium chelatase subunit D
MNTIAKLDKASLLFPFSAIVGQEAMKRALIFNAIDPSIGGLLITGTRGTAKSTAARSVAALLPEIEVISGDAFNTAPSTQDKDRTSRIPTPFVNLPVGATEDRVLGTLNVERMLQAGEKHFEPGLLARANRGVLYVDEVNLLPDHLVDILLDAVAMGVNRVEREGVSYSHEARVILVGTMNPEEGELRPQLLDRFALSVSASGYFDPAIRKEVVRRRIAFDVDPIKEVEKWREAELALSQQIIEARNSFASVKIPEEKIDAIVEACALAKADGLRADIVAYKSARAIAAFAGRREVNDDDIAEALSLALAHRRRSPATPRPPAGPDNGTGDKPPDESNPSRATASNTQSRQSSKPPETQAPTQTKSQSDDIDREAAPTPTSDRIFGVGQALKFSKLIVRRRPRKATANVPGRGSRMPARRCGQFVRAILPPASEKLDLALEATIRAAALESDAGQSTSLSLYISRRHWRHRQRQVRTRELVVLVVDASGSMAARERMQNAKGAVVSLLEDAYRRRDMVALIAFRGETSEEVLPPTRSAVFAYRRLAVLPTGGRTPLAAGLRRARQVIERQIRKGERVSPHLVLVSDGRATVPENGALNAALNEATRLREMQVRSLCLDMESGHIRFGQTKTLADSLSAVYMHIEQLPARAWGQIIQEWVSAEQPLIQQR